MAQKRHSHPIASQSKKPRRNIAHIADDTIFYEILPKLPVKSILRFKTVSKLWHEITSGHFFISRHLEQSRKNPKLTIMPYHSGRRALDLYMYDGKQGDNHYASFLFGKRPHMDLTRLEKFPHSNGLVLYNTARRLSVCNPSTRKSIKLPPGSRDKYSDPFCGMRGGFGLVSLNTDTRPAPSIFKVVQYFYRRYSFIKRTFSVGFEVFHVGIDSSWRTVAEDPPYPPYIWNSMCTSIAVYFFIENDLHKSAPQLMFSFDLKNETYSVIPNPPCFSDGGSGVKVTLEDIAPGFDCTLHVVDDSICLAVNDFPEGNKWDIWKYNADSSTWILYFSFEYPKYPSTDRIISLELLRVQYGKLLMRVFDESEKIVWYDPQNESFETVVLLDEDISYLKRNNIVEELPSCEPPSLLRVYSHVESLVPVTGMIGH